MNGLANTLRAAGRRLKWSRLLAGACGWLAVSLGLWLLLFLFDDLLSLPASLAPPPRATRCLWAMSRLRETVCSS